VGSVQLVTGECCGGRVMRDFLGAAPGHSFYVD
jgi:hypothetical protein